MPVSKSQALKLPVFGRWRTTPSFRVRKKEASIELDGKFYNIGFEQLPRLSSNLTCIKFLVTFDLWKAETTHLSNKSSMYPSQ